MSEQNVKIVQDCYAAFGSGNIPAFLAALTDDVDWSTPDVPDIPLSGHYKGPSGVAEFFKKLDAAIAFEQFEPRQFVAQGDTVVVIGYEKGTVKSTGKSEESDWVHVVTVRGGKIASFKEFINTAAVAAAFQS